MLLKRDLVKLKRMKSKKLNLGCGSDYRQGWINLDAWGKCDVKHDLRKLPLPFKSNTFEHIFSSHTLEHIEGKLTGLMIELHRILKPGGTLEIRVPHCSWIGALDGMEHRNSFFMGSWGIFCDKSYFKHMPDYPKLAKRDKPLFEMISYKLKHQRTDDGNRFLIEKKGIYYYTAKLISYLANLNPHFCEKIWCYWVGGFQEQQVILEKL